MLRAQMCRVLLLRYWVVWPVMISTMVTHASTSPLQVLMLMMRVHHDHCSVTLASRGAAIVILPASAPVQNLTVWCFSTLVNFAARGLLLLLRSTFVARFVALESARCEMISCRLVVAAREHGLVDRLLR